MSADKVDVVLGYISSGDCLAVAPIAEELKKMLVLMDCGTHASSRKPIQLCVPHRRARPMDNVGLIRYMKAKNVKMDHAVGINQDYAWGRIVGPTLSPLQDNFIPTPNSRRTAAEVRAGQYGTESPHWSDAGSDVVYSSLWGGDLQASSCRPLPRPSQAQLSWCSAPRSRVAAARRQDARRHQSFGARGATA